MSGCKPSKQPVPSVHVYVNYQHRPEKRENIPCVYSLRRLGWTVCGKKVIVSRTPLLPSFNTVEYSQAFCLKNVGEFMVSWKGKVPFV